MRWVAPSDPRLRAPHGSAAWPSRLVLPARTAARAAYGGREEIRRESGRRTGEREGRCGAVAVRASGGTTDRLHVRSACGAVLASDEATKYLGKLQVDYNRCAITPVDAACARCCAGVAAPPRCSAAGSRWCPTHTSSIPTSYKLYELNSLLIKVVILRLATGRPTHSPSPSLPRGHGHLAAGEAKAYPSHPRLPHIHIATTASPDPPKKRSAWSRRRRRLGVRQRWA